jgi:4a-hydroxytetrahydrobiopterin dehydratase
VAPTPLTSEALDALVAELDGWSVANGKLHREFRFADFVEAFGFMARAALVAERMNHHPDWANVWNTVTVDLVTHSAGGITDLDAELARAMTALAG